MVYVRIARYAASFSALRFFACVLFLLYVALSLVLALDFYRLRVLLCSYVTLQHEMYLLLKSL